MTTPLLEAAIKILRPMLNRHSPGHDAVVGLHRQITKILGREQAAKRLQCNCTVCASGRRGKEQ